MNTNYFTMKPSATTPRSSNTKLFLKYKFLMRFALVLSIMLALGQAWGVTITIIADANWSTAGIASNDDVIVRNGATLIVNGTYTCNSLQLGGPASAGAGTLTFTGVNPYLTVTNAVGIGGWGNVGRDGNIIFTSGSTLDAGSIVYGGTGSPNPGQATITMTAGGTLITGSITIGAGGGGTWTPGTGTLRLDANNTLPTTFFTSFNNLSINSNTTTLGTNISISGTLSLDFGLLVLGSNNLTMGASAAISGTLSATNMVVASGTGQFIRTIGSTGTYLFPIGDNTGTNEYSPVTLTFNANSNAAHTVGARVTDAAHPSNGVQTYYLTRYWTFSETNLGTYTYTGTFRYTNADIVGGNEANIKANRYNTTWYPVASSSASNVMTISSNLTETSGTLNGSEYAGRVEPSTTYVWDHSTSTDFTVATNWTPDRTTPKITDILQFNEGGSRTVTNVTSQIINQLIVSNSTNITLQSTGNQTLTISGGSGNNLDIQNGSTLQLGSTGANATSIAFLSATQNATIAGNLIIVANTSYNNSYIATNSNTVVTGSITNAGTITSTASNLSFSSGATYNHNYTTTAGTVPTATWHANSNLTFVGYTSNTTAPTGLTQSFGNFTWNCASQTGAIDLNSTLSTINGSFTMQNTNTGSLQLTATTTLNPLAIAGNLVLNGGTLSLTNGANNATLNVLGNYSQATGSTLNMNSSAGAGVGSINVKGNFSMTGGTINEAGSATTDAFNFNGTTTQTFTKSAGTISNVINFNVLSGTILDMGTSVLDGTNAIFSLNAGAGLVTAHLQGISSTASTGCIQVGGLKTYSATANYTFNGAASQVTGNSFVAANNLTISNTSGVTLTADATITGTVTLNQPFSITGRTLTLNGPAIAGTATNLTTTNTSNLTFGGSATGIIIPLSVTTLNNLTVNNTNGVSLSSNIVLSTAGILTLTNGNLSLGNFNFTVNTDVAGSPFSSSKMIVTNGTGSFIRTGTAVAHYQTTYPVGTTGYYSPMVIGTLAATTPSGSVSVRAISSRHPYVSLDNVALKKYWKVVTTGLAGISDARVTFDYNAGEVVGNSALYVPRIWNGTSFDIPSGATGAGVRPFGTNTAGNTILAGEWTAVDPTVRKTWYSYISGNWNDYNCWTLDGAGTPIFDNPSHLIPTANDIVIITNGRTITIPSSLNNVTVENIQVIGDLDLTTSHGHNFTNIEGTGRITMAGYDAGSGVQDNFPAGIVTGFVNNAIGGTVIINGTGLTLNQARTFNNLKINLTSGTATLLANYTINGNLIVEKGIFQINNNAADASPNLTPLTLTVNGNVQVESTGSISVGTANATSAAAAIGYGNYHKYFHVFTVAGNFTNQGSVRLTNQTAPNYTDRTTTGAVSLVFTSTTNKTFSCQGVTDLYYLVINKGTDQNYSLTINATAKNNFSLFGDNDSDWDATDIDNPESRKALWIKAGALILEGYVTIPTLTEGTRDFTIGATAALVLNGLNVSVSSTALSAATGVHTAIDYTGLSYSTSTGISNGTEVQGIYINGTLRVNNGNFYTKNSHGLVYREESTANRFELNGGVVTTGQFRISGYTNAASAKMTYIQSGGELNLVDNRTDAAIFDLSAGLGSFVMSGGTINIKDLSAGTINSIYIGCDASNISVTGGTIILNNPSMSNRVATLSTTAPFNNLILRANQGNGIDLHSTLTIQNDLSIEAEDFDARGFNLAIGSNLTISSGATYTTGSNTTTFNGTKQSTVYLPALQTFNNLTISKTVENKNFIIGSGLATAIQVNGELRVENGVFDYGTYFVSLKGNAFVADTIGKASSTGKIVFDGTVKQYLVSDGGIIKNIEINNSFGSGSNLNLTNDLTVYGNLTLTNGVFDISTYQLTLSGANASISGSFGTGKMIQTDGNASDGGLVMYIPANTSPTTPTITFPIGTNDNSVVRYTPLVAIFSGTYDDGYITVSVADNVLPTTNGNGNPSVLSYYWKLDHSGFTTLPTVNQYGFYNSTTDEGGAATNSWVCGKVLNESPYTRLKDDNYQTTSPYIIFTNAGTPFSLERASYTAGATNRFSGTLDIFYSTGTSGNYDWDDKNSWDKGSIGSGSSSAPTEGSIVIIRESCRINIRTAINNPGSVTFAQSLPTPTTEQLGRLQFHVAGTYNLGVIYGVGMVSFNAPTAPAVSGDFGDFGTKEYSYYLYFGGSTTLNSIPTPIPNLMIESGTYNINQAITTNGDLVVQGNAVVIPQQNATISGDLAIGVWQGGTFQFPSQATPVTVTVNGDIDFTNDPFTDPQDRNLIVQHAAQDVEHRLILKGSILHGSGNGYDIDLWNSNTLERVILELQGESNETYSRTSTSVPQLYRLIMNKGNDQTYNFTFNNSFSLNGVTNTASNKALELQKGKLVLNDPAINFSLTTGNEFTIPSTAALEVTQGTLLASGTDGGITLDGKLIINGGTVNMTGGASDKNFIEYGTSGNGTIDISSGNLIVGSQIRRLTSGDGGVLKYTQTGGTVLIGVNSNDAAYAADRGMLEVLNTGSNFTFTGGSLTIQRQNGLTPSVAALLLAPTTYDVSASTLTIGNDNTPEAQNNIGINSTIPLNNLTIYAKPGLTDKPNILLNINTLTLNGNLTSNANATFNGNGLDLTIKGNYINDGIYIASGNTLIFNTSTSQSLSGTGTEDIYKFTKSGVGTLSLQKSVTVNNLLSVSGGTLFTDTYSLTAKGNVSHDASITSTSGNGLVMEGTALQNLTRTSIGTSTIGILTINNPNKVQITDDGYLFSITNNLRLQAGIFDIGGSLLEVGENASITPVNAFSITNMIQTNSSFTDNGIRKYLPAILSSTDVVFPIGQTKYTPVTFTITSSDAGSLTVRPANEKHLTILEDLEAPNTEITDADNCLQYYWIIKSNSITSLTGSATFSYTPADLKVTVPYSSANYIPARLFDAGLVWDKAFGTDAFNEGANTFTVGFSAVSDGGISGDYTAGVGVNNSDVSINGAIPNSVSAYETSGVGGNYDADGTWATAIPSGGPVGSVITVKSGDVLTLNNNNIRIYRTIIEAGGVLEIDNTIQHRLGTVSGTGKIKMISNDINAFLPAGYYADFFSCSGGSLEYAGSGNYSILSGLTQVRNLTLSGTGTNNLASNASICESLVINGPTINNTDNKSVDVQGDMFVTSGTFNSGTSSTVQVDGTLNINGGTYNGQSGGTDSFNALNISSGAFNTGTGGTISIQGALTYSGGTFNGGSGTASILLNGTTNQTLTGSFTGGAEFYKLTINNAAGVTFGGSVTINNELGLTSGLINNGSNTLLLTSAAIITPEIGKVTSYVNGKLSKILASVGDDFVFPVGKGGRWGYAGVYNVTTGGLTWDVEYFPSKAPVSTFTPPIASGIVTITQGEYWKISDNGTSNANIKLSWNSNSKVSTNENERQKLLVVAWDGSKWDNYGGGSFSASHTAISGSFISAFLVPFSEKIITLGSSEASNPLPVTLLYFEGNPAGENIELYWATASELNNDYFEVQRSFDAVNFTTIGVVYGAGTSMEQLNYTYTDKNPQNGTNYYRLKQVDFDGAFEIHKTVSVVFDKTGNLGDSEDIIVYPNPYNGGDLMLGLQKLEPYTSIGLSIMDIRGKQIYRTSLIVPEDKNVNIVPLAVDRLPQGIYFISVRTAKKVMTKKVVVN